MCLVLGAWLCLRTCTSPSLSLTWVLWSGSYYVKGLVLHRPQLAWVSLRAVLWNWSTEQFTLWNMLRRCLGSQLICHFGVNVLKMACLMPHSLFSCTVNVGSRRKFLALQLPYRFLILECLWYQRAYNMTSWLLSWLSVFLKTWENFCVAT